MTHHKPFEIRAALKTPITFSRPVRLSGLMYHCALMHTSNEVDAKELLLSLFLSTQNVLHASSMIFGISPHHGLVATNRTGVGKMSNEIDLNRDLLAPNGANGKYSTVLQEGGPTKVRMIKERAYQSLYILFYGNGDAEKVCQLLNQYVTSVGNHNNSGAGTVSGWTVTPTKTDHSLIDTAGITGTKNQGMPMTPLPESVYHTLTQNQQHDFDVQEMALTPPFYNQIETERCVIPNTISYKLI
jgi:hypothetical protein